MSSFNSELSFEEYDGLDDEYDLVILMMMET
jgi:hypothetical protein